MSQYNLRSPAVKRLMREVEELKNPAEEYYAQPLEDNLFEWHFTIRGPPNSEFEGGIYHGRISLPSEYPMKPPSIILLTPNGRFEINKKICLSISGHHPESWQPSWSIRTALLAIIGFLPTHGNGAIGSLDYTPEERMILASKSQDWKCPECGNIKECLKSPETESTMEPYVWVAESSTEHNVQRVQTVSFSSDGENVATEKKVILSAQDQHSGKTSIIENVNTNSVQDDCGDLPSIFTELEITATENAPTIRQRNVVSCGLSAESEQSDNAISTQPASANSIHNYLSLVMIWVISVILFILIVRRWLSYDYSL